MRTQEPLTTKKSRAEPAYVPKSRGSRHHRGDYELANPRRQLQRNGSGSSDKSHSEMNENHTVFMIGLPTTTDQAYFSNWIRKELPKLNFKQIKFPKSKQKGAFAFIEFEDEASRNGILELPHLLFNNRELKFQPYRTGEELQRYRETVQRRRLYIFGFKPTFTKKDLKSIFSGFGELDDAYIIKDRKTGKSKCFGYVIYKSVETATQVAEMSSLEYKGSTVRFKMHERKKKNQGYAKKSKIDHHSLKKPQQKQGNIGKEHQQKKPKKDDRMLTRKQQREEDHLSHQANLDYNNAEIEFQRALEHQQLLEYNHKRFFDPSYSLLHNQRLYRKFIEFHTSPPQTTSYYKRRGIMKHFEQNLVFRKPADSRRTGSPIRQVW